MAADVLSEHSRSRSCIWYVLICPANSEGKLIAIDDGGPPWIAFFLGNPSRHPGQTQPPGADNRKKPPQVLATHVSYMAAENTDPRAVTSRKRSPHDRQLHARHRIDRNTELSSPATLASSGPGNSKQPAGNPIRHQLTRGNHCMIMQLGYDEVVRIPAL